jgi:hypothetical protein
MGPGVLDRALRRRCRGRAMGAAFMSPLNGGTIMFRAHKPVGERVLGAGKILWGATRVASGLATGFGVGLVGHVLYAHHLKGVAVRYGQMTATKGGNQVVEGFKELFE